jgi:hypothetical protein
MEDNNLNNKQNDIEQSRYASEGLGGAEKPHKSTGPIIGIAIIIVIIIFGGLYYWGAQLTGKDGSEETEKPTAEEIESAEDTAVSELETQSNSDEISAIEEDLNATDLEGLDAELENIDAEFNF